MINTINELIKFIQSLLLTFWLILIYPKQFKKNFFPNEDGTNENVNVVGPYFFLIFSIFTFSIFVLNISVDVISSSEAVATIAKAFETFSLAESASNLIPLVLFVLAFALLMSKLYFFKKKEEELFKRTFTWIMYMFSFQILLICLGFILVIIFNSLSQLFFHSQSDTSWPIIFIPVSFIIGIVWPFVIVLSDESFWKRSRIFKPYRYFAEKIKHEKYPAYTETKQIFFRGWHFVTALIFPLFFLLTTSFMQDINEEKNVNLSANPFQVFHTKAKNDSVDIMVDLRFINKSLKPIYLTKEDPITIELIHENENRIFKSEMSTITKWSGNNEEILPLLRDEPFYIHVVGSLPNSVYSYCTDSPENIKLKIDFTNQDLQFEFKTFQFVLTDSLS